LHSHEQAAFYLEQAIAVTFEEEDRIELRLRAAQSAVSVGHLERGEEHYRAALDWYTERGDRRSLRVAARLGRMLLYASKVDESMAVVQAALPTAEPDSREFIELNAELARAHMFRDEPELALAACERALAAAEEQALVNPTIMLLITKSWALIALRRPRESSALLMGALEMARAEGFVAAEVRAVFNLVGYIVTDKPREAVALGLQGLAKARQFGLALNATNLSGNIASADLIIGDLRHILRIEGEAEELQAPISLGLHGYAAGAVALMGDPDGARQRLEQLERATAETSSAQDRSQLGNVRAVVAFGAGDIDSARRHAREGRDAYFGSDGPIAGAFATRLSILMGDLEGARTDLDRLGEYEMFGTWIARSVREGEAGILALTGDVEGSLAAYRRVIADWRADDMPLDLALSLFLRARLLGSVDAEAAEGHAEAAGILAAIGADGLLERIEASLPPPAAPAATRSPQALSEDAAAARR
jgi:tetratricopeptide (TPR) repeat protein